MQTKERSRPVLLEALAAEFPESSKSTLRQWIASGRVLVNGSVLRDARAPLPPGARVALRPRAVCARFGSHTVSLPILYRDQDLLFLEKPSGLLSVAAAYEQEQSAHAILEQQLRQTVYPVHRLDRETSGVLCYALHLRAQQALKNLFAQHDLQRQYLAVVEGRPVTDAGEWRSWLREDPVTYQVTVSHARDPQAEEAITYWKVLRTGSCRALLQLTLETGKKHQIRVQCAQAGTPVVGDPRYGGAARRLALHATSLGLEHPFTGQWLEAKSPMPQVMEKMLHQRPY